MTPIWEYSWNEVIIISIACFIIGTIINGIVIPLIIKHMKKNDKKNK